MGKHSSEKEKGKGKTILLSIIFVIILSIIAVLVYNNFFVNKNNPEDAINTTFQALKTYDKETANKYIDYNQLLYSLDEMIVNEKNDGVCRELFKDMEWKIEGIEVDNDTATVIVEVTNKDFIKVMTSWMKKMIGEKAKGTQVTTEISMQKLENALSETKDCKTEMKKINLVKEENNWKIVIDESLRDLVYPSIDSVATALTK